MVGLKTTFKTRNLRNVIPAHIPPSIISLVVGKLLGPKFWNPNFKSHLYSNHVAKFHDDQPMELGDLVLPSCECQYSAVMPTFMNLNAHPSKKAKSSIKVYFAKCKLQNAEIWKDVFCKISPLIFSAFTFRKIQIKSNNQLRVGLGLHLSLESTSAQTQKAWSRSRQSNHILMSST